MNSLEANGLCKRCHCEIVAMINDSLFGEGECGACEYLRYRTQPELLRLTIALRNACDDRISILEEEREKGMGDPDDVQDQIDHWKVLQRRCEEVLAEAAE
jgi:hypothetical protein